MASKLRKAMILAAGFGTRLKPLTLNTPKALVKYQGIPLILHVITKLSVSGIEEILIIFLNRLKNTSLKMILE